MTAPDNFAEAMRGDRVVLIARCGGGNGACGKVRAVLLDDGTVRYAPLRCHRFDAQFPRRPEVAAAFAAARRNWERARRSRRPFTPPSIAVRPLLRNVRRHREIIEARDWARFEASDPSGLDDD